MDENVIYRANISSASTTIEELAYLKDDLLEVAIPVGGGSSDNVKHWFKAINTRTKMKGYVTLNSLIRVDNSSLVSSKAQHLPLSNLESGFSQPSDSGTAQNTDNITPAVTTVVATMAALTLTKTSKESNSLAMNLTSGTDPYSNEDIYVQCVNPSSTSVTGLVNKMEDLNNITINNYHKTVPVYFVTPIICLLCRDYIWGVGPQGQQCINCWSCYHINCLPLAIHHVCQRNTEVYPKIPITFNSDKSITEWTSANVLEWMAALNLYTYADVFKAKDIKGCDLTNLDRDKLGQMGIKNEFHQQTILACIKDLLNSGETPIQTNIVILDDTLNNQSTPCVDKQQTINEHSHELVDHSFSKLEKCDKCHQYMRGLLHQGLLCKQCKLIVHRQCSVTGLNNCAEVGNKTSATQSNREHVFGTGLCSQFNTSELPAPKLIIILCNDLEQKALCNMNLDLYKLYRTTPTNYDEVIKLRDSLNDDVISTDLNGYSPECVATVLKKFLRELPDPIVPVQFYDSFLGASKCSSDKQSIQQLIKLVRELPEHHSSTLKFMMKHLIRICRMQFQRGLKEQPTILIQVWCHIIMRPPWEKIVQIVYNTEAHLRIMELLLYKGDWDEKLPEFLSAPAIPPRKISRVMQQGTLGVNSALSGSTMTLTGAPTKKMVTSPSPGGNLLQTTMIGAQSIQNVQSKVISSAAVDSNVTPTDTNGSLLLKDAEWYWGKITRDQAKEQMMETEDGSFLVRDATSGCGEYTLTLKKDGADRVIKIYHSMGKYGFTRDCTFSTVVELINFFRNTSLKEYNTILDIKLLYPVSRLDYDLIGKSGDKHKIAQQFIEIDHLLSLKQTEFELLSEQYTAAKNQVDMKRQANEAFIEAEKMFADQLSMQARCEKEAQPHEKLGLAANNQLIHERMAELDICKNQLLEVISKEKDVVRQVERSINKLHPEINSLRKEKDRYQEWLRTCGVNENQFKQMINEGYCAWARNEDNQETAHSDEMTWFLPNCSRNEAEQYLANKPTGTFLIRARHAGHFALSITCNDTPNHCIIHGTERGYGFAEPYNIYETLKSLVLHYATNSLEEHNDSLQTTLKYPVFQQPKQAQTQHQSSSSSASSMINNFTT